jgi:hypothetical protein
MLLHLNSISKEDKSFAAAFIQNNGLSIIGKYQLLSPDA